MIFDIHIALRLLLAALLGAVVGLEREKHHQPAGLRTHMILAIGAALAMCISIDLAIQFRPYAPNGDPARLAAQVISGIGFLGAGAILRYGSSVKGLTTATSLWTVAIIGLAVGAGHFIPAAVATVLLLIVLSILDVIEKKMIVGMETRAVTIKAADRPRFVEELRQVIRDFRMDISSVSVSKDVAANEIEVDAIVKASQKTDMDKFVGALSAIPGAKGFDIH